MSTATTASRAHSDLAERLSNPDNHFAVEFAMGLREGLAASIPIFQQSIDLPFEELTPGFMERIGGALRAFRDGFTATVTGCRTYLIESSLGPALAAHMDSQDPEAKRFEPPEPYGFVWFATPMELPHANGVSQRFDAMTWSLMNVADNEESEPVRRYFFCWWTHTGDGRGEDELHAWSLKGYDESGRERPAWYQVMTPWRLGSVNHLTVDGLIGPARAEFSDADIDLLIERDFDLVNTDAPTVSAMVSAIFGLLTGKLPGLDAGGERPLVTRDEEPNRAATKRARRGRRAPQVHAVSLGERYRGSGTLVPQPGTGSPLTVQAYTPGYWRRPRGTARDHPRTIWVQGFWRGDPDAPISENSTVYVARAPRKGI